MMNWEKLSLADIEEQLTDLKGNDARLFQKNIKSLKDTFEDSGSITYLNKIALVFSTFKIHSAVPLIVEKLLSGKYNTNGGTLVYALTGLKRKKYYSLLVKISQDSTISYEMKAMFDTLKVR
jgi:hypothetical protein